ncbi:MAG TPA: hypothetical protein DCX89_10005 [Saprospirales bacterium]|nr:hypothetical protein [Saprospirales bacterium]
MLFYSGLSCKFNEYIDFNINSKTLEQLKKLLTVNSTNQFNFGFRKQEKLPLKNKNFNLQKYNNYGTDRIKYAQAGNQSA